MKLNLSREMFSRYGSYISLGWQDQPNGYLKCPFGEGMYLRNHHARMMVERELAKLEVLKDGVVLPVGYDNFEADATEMRINAGDGIIHIAFDTNGNLMIRCEKIGLRFNFAIGTASVAYSNGPGLATVNQRPSTKRYQFQSLHGDLVLDAPWGLEVCDYMQVDILPSEDGIAECAVDEFWSTWVKPESRPDYQAVQNEAKQNFDDFLEAFGSAPKDESLADGWARAIYVMWACCVRPYGQLERTTMFMSKHWMDQVWSWDNCFNAQACIEAHPELAWDQWQIVFDHQDEFGAIPDGTNDVFKHYNFCKPPVHGWTVRHLINNGPSLSEERLKEVYNHLAAHTNWFLTHRKLEQHPLPYYLHGNDSGWDNGTMFDDGVPLVAPDLAGLLVTQTEVLSEIATKLGKADEAAAWQSKSDNLLAALLELWDGKRFVPQRLVNGTQLSPVDCDSLIPLIPIFLGNRLPEDVRAELAKGLERLTTEHGLATEYPESPRYTPDGYWRGPIWAPSTYLAIVGLADAGFEELAKEIAQRFCRTCAREGMAENFNAITGEGLRDRAYTWTASVYVLLAKQYC